VQLKAVVGDLRKALEADAKAGARAVTRSIKAETDALKLELRGQVTGAGLGARLANTWRGKVYPEGRESLGSAGIVWTKAPSIIDAFERGALIRGRTGWLAIPLPAAPRRVLGTRVTPGNLEKAWNIRLRMVYRRGKPSLLVSELRASRGKRGGFRAPTDAARRAGRGLASVPLFVLLPAVKAKKLLSVRQAGERALRRLPGRIVTAWNTQAANTIRERGLGR
jgi:hypothetical protein